MKFENIPGGNLEIALRILKAEYLFPDKVSDPLHYWLTTVFFVRQFLLDPMGLVL